MIIFPNFHIFPNILEYNYRKIGKLSYKCDFHKMGICYLVVFPKEIKGADWNFYSNINNILYGLFRV